MTTTQGNQDESNHYKQQQANVLLDENQTPQIGSRAPRISQRSKTLPLFGDECEDIVNNENIDLDELNVIARMSVAQRAQLLLGHINNASPDPGSVEYGSSYGGTPRRSSLTPEAASYQLELLQLRKGSQSGVSTVGGLWLGVGCETAGHDEGPRKEILSVQERLKQLSDNPATLDKASVETGIDLAEDKGDELTGLNLADKRKLFNSPQPKKFHPVLRRKTRTNTQPISYEDMMRAKHSQEKDEKDEKEKREKHLTESKVSSTLIQESTNLISAETEHRQMETVPTEPTEPVLRRRSSGNLLKNSGLRRVQSEYVCDTGDMDGEEDDESLVNLAIPQTGNDCPEGISVRQLRGELEARSSPTRVIESAKSRYPEELGKWTKNSAVARRRLRRLEQRHSFAAQEGDPDDDEDNNGITIADMDPVSSTAPTISNVDAEKSGVVASGSSTSKGRRVRGHISRRLTQPITWTEKEDVMDNGEDDRDVCVTQSLQERIAQMKAASETNWKERIKRDPSPDLELLKTTDAPKETDNNGQVGNVEERRKQLKTSQEEWRERIEDSDAKQFSAEGKLKNAGIDTTKKVPFVVRHVLQRRSSRTLSFHGRATSLDSNEDSDETSSSVRKLPFQPRAPTMLAVNKESVQVFDTNLHQEEIPNEPEMQEISNQNIEKTNEAESNHESEEIDTVTVSIPKIDQEKVEEFFGVADNDLPKDKIVVETNDFDHLQSVSDKITVEKRNLRPNRHVASQKKNPMKELSNREDIKTEYTEKNLSIAERRKLLQRKKEEASKRDLDDSAIAGLASTANFESAKVALRRVTEEDDSAGPSFLREVSPYKKLMLIQVKGRRHVQARLVQPRAESINSGDSFVLVSTERVFIWLGEFANVIEQNKATELGQWIVNKRDLGHRGPAPMVIVEEKRKLRDMALQFWTALGYDEVQHVQGPGSWEEDELYEQYILETNCVYRVTGNQLLPYVEWWGKPLRYSILGENEAFVFDFGSEMYFWVGKHIPMSVRKVGLHLAKLLVSRGYDYSECAINPLSPLLGEEEGGPPLTSVERPEWVLLGKVSQNMETVLFKEKFLDWPDTSRLITVKGSGNMKDTKMTTNRVDMASCNVTAMINHRPPSAHLIFEGRSVGRGGKWRERVDGIMRQYEVVTKETRVWHVSEFSRTELDPASHGQFHKADTYVIRWEYSIVIGGPRRGGMRDPGKFACAYFFWQGQFSSVTEKGASALMTVELDEEKGPQIRVTEGLEPPAFCHLFGSRMIIHSGRRNDPFTTNAVRVFLVRGDRPEEGHLYEVPPQRSSLRTRSVLIVVCCGTGQLFLWKGRLAPEYTIKVARGVVTRIIAECPYELCINPNVVQQLEEIEEGQEPEHFWNICGGTWVSPYKEVTLHPIRVWRLSGITGQLLPMELINSLQPDREEKFFSPLFVLQSTMYSYSQPGLFLLDGGPVIYLWQGYWKLINADEQTEDSVVAADGAALSPDRRVDPSSATLAGPEGSNQECVVGGLLNKVQKKTGSAQARFDAERIAALRTLQQYCEVKKDIVRRSVVVYAGLEPDEFQQLFPFWETDEEAYTSNSMEGKKPGQEDDAEDYLNWLTSLTFTMEELSQTPLPEGVDPMRMETYLSEEEFEEVFKVSKSAFYEFPFWKQTEMKKRLALF